MLDKKTPLLGHANGMAFYAYDADDRLLLKRIYYSIGGGFVVSEEELQRMKTRGPAKRGKKVPYPSRTPSRCLSMAAKSGLSIAEMKRANEEVHMSREELDERPRRASGSAMRGCIERGLSQDGIMPGGLKVRRRARQLHDKLQEQWRAESAQSAARQRLAVDLCHGGERGERRRRARRHRADQRRCRRVPAVMRYWLHFHPEADQPSIRDFLLTAAAIGGIIKTNASISGAEVGCQGEVGSASAMAAAGLCAVMGGTPEQVENAAEIALEHHLGMTCDPVGGLVQVPCIERNALGAVKAVTAASLAIKGDGRHFVPLDAAIETMRQTGLDMSEKYKETSLGGLAVNVVEC